MYGFQPSTPTDRLLPLARATTDASERLANIVEIRYVIRQLLILSKKEWQLDLHDHNLIFKLEILYIFPLVGCTFANKNANT
jgi:hypothetical protein